jgi:hypothetical protein
MPGHFHPVLAPEHLQRNQDPIAWRHAGIKAIMSRKREDLWRPQTREIKMERFRTPIIIAVIALAVAVSMTSKSPAETAKSPPEREFAAGDVVEIDKDGLECFAEKTSLDDLIEAISTDRKTWPGRLFSVCGDLDPIYAYEIMKVSDGAGPYKHIYCVNGVYDFPTNKSGCTWAVFPLGRTHLSSCKAGPALPPGTLIKQRAPGEDNWDVTERVPPHLPCQGHYLD